MSDATGALQTHSLRTTCTSCDHNNYTPTLIFFLLLNIEFPQWLDDIHGTIAPSTSCPSTSGIIYLQSFSSVDAFWTIKFLEILIFFLFRQYHLRIVNVSSPCTSCGRCTLNPSFPSSQTSSRRSSTAAPCRYSRCFVGCAHSWPT